MITAWETLADALRNELQEYGELLNLFDKQQAAILKRDPDTVLVLNDSITAQMKLIDQRRGLRESLVRESAGEAGRPPESSLGELMAFFPESVRSLFRALAEEVNNLLRRTKRRAQQNQMLLRRSIEVSQGILHRLNPGAVTKTYSSNGQLNISVAGKSSRCVARR
jgi:flagellar biosynthesis/type III secretory pathway chaperone